MKFCANQLGRPSFRVPAWREEHVLHKGSWRPKSELSFLYVPADWVIDAKQFFVSHESIVQSFEKAFFSSDLMELADHAIIDQSSPTGEIQ